MKTLTALLSTLLVASATLLGTPAAQAETTNIAFVVKDMTNPYYWRMRAGAEEAAAEKDINLLWTAAQFNGDIQGQIGIVESQLVRQPDALVLVPMNATALCPKVRQANRQGVPVINPDTRLAAENCGDSATFVGLDEKALAVQLAEFVVEETGGEANVAILEGFRGSSTAEDRLEGFVEVFDQYDGMNVVASSTAEWDREKGLKVTEDFLQAHPDLDVIVASNDQMALGAIQAVKSAGKADQIEVVGVDAIPAALDALRNGELLATVDGNTDRVGYESVMAAYAVAAEGADDLPAWTKVPSRILLQEDVTEEYLQSRGIEP